MTKSQTDAFGIGPKRKCRRCGLQKSAHVIDDKCADGRDYLAAGKTGDGRASSSFSRDEINLLRVLLKNAATGYSSTVLARQPAYSTLSSKVTRMIAAAERTATRGEAAE